MSDGLLQPGEACWRVAQADRAALLIDSAEYFAALKSALVSARHSIWILAWVFDPLTRLTPDRTPRSGDPARADRLGLLLRRLAALKPGLDVRILAWNMPFAIAASQAFAPQRAQAYFSGSRVKFQLDHSLPHSACHHQKVILIDGRLAFVSGGDVGADRWDTCDHADHDRRRRLPNGRHYPARHEVSAMLEGPIAEPLGQLFIDRWRNATGERLSPPLATEASPWPGEEPADLRGVRVALARTLPHWKAQAEVQEVLHAHLAMIGAARRLIYVENQYLTARVIVEALAARLREADGPQVVLVSPSHSPSFFDQATMDPARAAAIRRLRRADRYGRFSAYCARTPAGGPIIVHSKVMIIDDRILRIGSANLNNRSLGLDTELDLIIEAREGEAGEAARRAIAGFRARLVGHFIGKAQRTLEAAIAHDAGLAGVIGEMDGEPRRLFPTPASRLSAWKRLIVRYKLGDPTAPSDAWRPWLRRGRIRRQLSLLKALRPEAAATPPVAADDPTPAERERRTAIPPI